MSDCTAFRRQVCRFSEKLSDEDRRKIVYIRLFHAEEKYKKAETLDILSRLEYEGLFSPAKPEGLIEIARDASRHDLASELKKFVKTQRTASKEEEKSQKRLKGLSQAATESDMDLHLRCNFEVTLSQATVLMQNVDQLQQAITAGQGCRQRVEEAIQEARQTAERLAQTLRKMQGELESDSGSDSSSTDVSPIPDESKDWETSRHELPVQIQSLIVPAKPTPKLRRSKKCAQEGLAGLRAPVQETGNSAQSTTGYMANTHLQASASGSPSVPKPSSLMKLCDKRQSAPSTPSMERVNIKPAVPPRTLPRRSPAPTQLLSCGSSATLPSVARLPHHAMFQHDDGSDNNVDLENEELEDSTAGTGDSGYSEVEHWKGYMQHPPSRPPIPDPHNRGYMGLNRSQMEALGDYKALEHRDFEQEFHGD